ncbi:hypothetical protein ACLHZW_04985 [Aeromonas media]|uniref:hypothetical protein n=1 Tax=Aeromonas media TaxID=651 RepID=UPI003CFE0F58
MSQLKLDANKVTETLRDLDVSTSNRAIYHALVGHAYIQEIAGELGLPLPPSYRLICVTTRLGGDKLEIALVNDYTSEVAYYNQLSIVHHEILKFRPATQQRIWRSFNHKHKAALRDLPSAVLFSYILARYDVLLSDNIQTGEGMHFWKAWMSEALYRKLYVYHYQPMTYELLQIRTDAELADLSDQIWGSTQSYQRQLAIIACKPLPRSIQVSI